MRQRLVRVREVGMEWRDTYADNLRWLRRMWRHYWAARRDTSHILTPTRFWACAGGTVALLLNREDERLLNWNVRGGEEVAWLSTGTYYTDFGDGQAWDFLRVRRCKFAVGSDGSL